MCVGEGVGGSLGVLTRFVWRSLSVEWVGWGVGGWVSEFWTSSIVYMLIPTMGMSTVKHFNFAETLFGELKISVILAGT